MRTAILMLTVGLMGAPAAMAQTSLDQLAVQTTTRDFPATPQDAPDTIMIDSVLATALRAEPIDGGREKTLYLRLDGGRLTLDRAIEGQRYRATARCADCGFTPPFTAHTHPYENPFSVQDLRLAINAQTPILMAARDGRLWLAVPTRLSLDLPPAAFDGWLPIRYALFGGRLECPARTPADGWASDTVMARRVEGVARAAAEALHLTLYVAEPGEPFRKLAPMPADVDLLRWDRPFTPDELNVQEISLLRLIHAAADGPDARPDWPAPDQETPGLDAVLAAPPGPERSPGLHDGLRKFGDLTTAGHDRWIGALPTTVYALPFADPTISELPFASVQNSADCRDILVLHGVQSFAPDGVRYTRGWRRARASTAPITRDWTPVRPEDFPTDHVVPW